MSSLNITAAMESIRAGQQYSPSQEDYLLVLKQVGQVAEDEAHARAHKLAIRQGVKPIRMNKLTAGFWPEEENTDEFLSWLADVRSDDQDRSLPE